MNNQVKYSFNLLKNLIHQSNINLNKRIDEINEENNIILSSISSRIDNLELIVSKIDNSQNTNINKSEELNIYNLSDLNKKIEKLENDIGMLQIKKNISMNISHH